MKYALHAAVMSVVLLLAGSAAHAADHGITGKRLLLKGGTSELVVKSKDPSFSIAGSSPVGGSDSSITFDNRIDPPVTLNLPANLWSANGAGTLFKYKNAAAPDGPSMVKAVKLKPGLLKVVAKGLPFSVPYTGSFGSASIGVVLSLDGGNDRYCMTFTGTGDGDKFLVKDAPIGTCQLCGDTVREGTEICDGADAPTCPGSCQPNCTCPVCGDNARQGTEECDGTDDASCPTFCLGNCTCNGNAEACCQFLGSCGGGSADSCTFSGGTPVGGGAVCDASGTCGQPPASPGGCCAFNAPTLFCNQADQISCENAGATFVSSALCSPEGACLPPCQATTGGFCWFSGIYGDDCDTTCYYAGRLCAPATITFAGSNDFHCAEVLHDLFGSVIFVPGEWGSVGCTLLDFSHGTRATGPTTCGASETIPHIRVCACG